MQVKNITFAGISTLHETLGLDDPDHVCFAERLAGEESALVHFQSFFLRTPSGLEGAQVADTGRRVDGIAIEAAMPIEVDQLFR